MKHFILDASTTLSWCFEDERAPGGEAALDALGLNAEALAPALWTYEVLNVLTIARRRKQLTQAQSTTFWNELRKLPIEVMSGPSDDTAVEIMALAEQYALSAYDAAYLELALRKSLPLATLDANLNRAARTAGVKNAFSLLK